MNAPDNADSPASVGTPVGLAHRVPQQYQERQNEAEEQVGGKGPAVGFEEKVFENVLFDFQPDRTRT